MWHAVWRLVGGGNGSPRQARRVKENAPSRPPSRPSTQPPGGGGGGGGGWVRVAMGGRGRENRTGSLDGGVCWMDDATRDGHEPLVRNANSPLGHAATLAYPPPLPRCGGLVVRGGVCDVACDFFGVETTIRRHVLFPRAASCQQTGLPPVATPISHRAGTYGNDKAPNRKPHAGNSTNTNAKVRGAEWTDSQQIRIKEEACSGTGHRRQAQSARSGR